MKLCKDCKYIQPAKCYIEEVWSWRRFRCVSNIKPEALKFAKCIHPNNITNQYHLISGQEPEADLYCANLRKDYPHNSGKFCGTEGRWFEPKEPK